MTNLKEGSSTTDEALGLHSLFNPRSIAVVGASHLQAGVGGFGANFLRALKEMRFPRPIYPVNPKYDEIEGLKCYPNLRDIQDPVDYVIVAIPPHAVPEIVEDSVAARVKTIHVFAAGFRETGKGESADLEKKIASRAREAGIRLLGPNCMGIYSPKAGLSFMPGFPTEAGPLAFISQSGNHAGDFIHLAATRGVYFSRLISYGNAADIDESELLDYLATDDDTEIIAFYVEGVKDGQRYLRAMERAARVKPLIVVKGGRTEAGARAVRLHTGALAGSSQEFASLCRQVGAIPVNNIDELADLAVAIHFLRPLNGRRMGIMASGGGIAVASADQMSQAGLLVPELPEEIQQTIQPLMPPVGTSTANPVDTNVANPDTIEQVLSAIGSSDNIDVVVYYIRMGWGLWRWTMEASEQDPSSFMDNMVAHLVKARDANGKPLVMIIQQILSMWGTELSLPMQEKCARAGLPVFTTIDRAANAIAKAAEWREAHGG